MEMEIIVSNKQIKELAKINNAQSVKSFSYNGSAKYKFISLTNEKLAKCILYVDHKNNYYLEIRR